MDFTLFYIPRSNFDIPLSDHNIPCSDSGAWNMDFSGPNIPCSGSGAWDMEIKSMKHVNRYRPGRCTMGHYSMRHFTVARGPCFI